MNSFIRQKVVKRYAVEVAGPCLVDSQFEEFQVLVEHLTVLAPSEQGIERERGREADSESEVWLPGEAMQIVYEAKQQAEDILNAARLEAERIIREAEEGAVKAREGLEAAVRAEVIPLAQESGFQAGFAQGKAEAELLKREAERLVQLAEVALRSEYERADHTLLHLAIKIAERIVRGTLGIEPQRLLDIARSLTLLPQEREDWVLHVAPEDGEWLRSLESETVPCPWISDETLRPGECFLECEEGIFDARFETQLEKLERSLREELKHEGLEPARSED